MKKLFVNSFKTSIGTVRTAATDKGLALICLPGESKRHFEERVRKLFDGHQVQSGGEVNRKAQKQIIAYLDGKRTRFDLPLDLHGTPFQKTALRRVARIPYGKVKTYGEIAAAIGKPRAARAVGSANARNNLPLVIPCHRVVATNGLGGYGGGLTLKKRLLKMEGSL